MGFLVQRNERNRLKTHLSPDIIPIPIPFRKPSQWPPSIRQPHFQFHMQNKSKKFDLNSKFDPLIWFKILCIFAIAVSARNTRTDFQQQIRGKRKSQADQKKQRKKNCENVS